MIHTATIYGRKVRLEIPEGYMAEYPEDYEMILVNSRGDEENYVFPVLNSKGKPEMISVKIV